MLTEPELLRIYADTIDALYAFVSRRCGGIREVAEDITQDTWLRALRDWRAHGVPEVPIAWLTTVARNLLANTYRHPEQVPLDGVTQERLLAAADEQPIGDDAGVAQLVSYALTKLPPAEARLLEAFHFDRFKVAQIAEAYGVSERAIEGRLRRARERLRRELETVLKAQGGLA
ncbi:MAG TPA: sigma-70 family RNA polymerase sigma factor [Gemmatimonadaceae bacterium]|nr:sigma-70 family RNA polymerase sigma factor [Gemmatimonadaceae bacterium]